MPTPIKPRDRINEAKAEVSADTVGSTTGYVLPPRHVRQFPDDPTLDDAWLAMHNCAAFAEMTYYFECRAHALNGRRSTDEAKRTFQELEHEEKQSRYFAEPFLHQLREVHKGSPVFAWDGFYASACEALWSLCGRLQMRLYSWEQGGDGTDSPQCVGAPGFFDVPQFSNGYFNALIDTEFALAYHLRAAKLAAKPKTSSAAVNEATPLAGSPLSTTDLANLLQKPAAAVESFLRRYRDKYPDCYFTTEAPRRNEPKYLYRVADVLPALKEHFRTDQT